MLMKKIWFLMLGLLAMVSCEQEDLDSMVKGNAQQVQTRAATSAADFDPINELSNSGVPLNIINVGNSSRKYLSCVKSGDKVDLFTKDDGSMRQRWQIYSGGIALVGGNSMIPPPMAGNFPQVFIRPNSSTGETYPKLGLGSFPFSHGFETLNNGNCCIYRSPKTSSDTKYYLQSETRSGSGLKYKNSPYTDLAQWKLVPVGEFNLVDMDYVKSEIDGDIVNRKDQFLMGAIFPSEPFDIEHTLTVNETVRESSTFNETSSVSTMNQSSFHWSSQSGQAPLPVVTLSGDVSTTTTSSESVSYTRTGGYDVSVSQSFKVVIPANTKCRVEVLKISYNTSLTYIATLEKVDGGLASGKRFKIKGKWNGIVTTYLYYNIYRFDDNELLSTRIVDAEV